MAKCEEYKSVSERPMPRVHISWRVLQYSKCCQGLLITEDLPDLQDLTATSLPSPHHVPGSSQTKFNIYRVKKTGLTSAGNLSWERRKVERDSLLSQNSLTHLSLMVIRIEASQTMTTPDRTPIPAFESVVNTTGCFSFWHLLC
jgi:hypothetical protein